MTMRLDDSDSTYMLIDHITGEVVQLATPEEIVESRESIKDGDLGLIDANGRQCYVCDLELNQKWQ
jgi:hypothetical protein